MTYLSLLLNLSAISYTFHAHSGQVSCIRTVMCRRTYTVTHQEGESLTEMEAAEKMTRLTSQGFK